MEIYGNKKHYLVFCLIVYGYSHIDKNFPEALQEAEKSL